MELSRSITREFFQNISNGQKINFEYIHEQGIIQTDANGQTLRNHPYKSKMKYYSKEAISEFSQWNSKGYGIYFLPNFGGYKDNEITDFRACFADLDIKDEIEHELILNGFIGAQDELKSAITERFIALTAEETGSYKKLFIKRIDELRRRDIVPTSIIETKNGYHVYYFLNHGTEKSQFEAIEDLLIYCLNADSKVKNPARLLRVPDTEHLKDPDKPFTICMKEWNVEARYAIDQLEKGLRNLLADRQRHPLLFSNPRKQPHNRTTVIGKQVKLPQKRTMDYSSYELGNIPLISKGFDGLIELKERLGLNSQLDICYINREDIRQYLKRQDLKMLLGIGTDRFYCLFHRSSNPSSGSIYMHDEKYYYKCHSSSCGVHYDIVNIVERVTGLPNYKAFEYLKSLYNIAEVKTEWQTEMERLIEINLDLIERFRYDSELREQYPKLTKFLSTKGTLGLLIQIHEIARRKLPQLARIKDLNSAIVFAPMNMVVEEIINDHLSSLNKIYNANTKAVILIFFYLLNCIGIEQLPDELQRKAKEFQRTGSKVKGKLVYYKTPPRYYEIVSLDTDRLIIAEDMATFFYEQKLTLASFNREQLLRLCGDEEADRIFPDRADEEISEKNQMIASEIESTFNGLIHAKGWTNDKELIENIRIKNFDIKTEFRNTFKYIKSKESDAIDHINISDDNQSMWKWYQSFMLKKIKLNMPAILINSSIRKARINVKLRNRLNIPEDIQGNVYCKEDFLEEIETVEVEDIASKIRSLKYENPKLKNSKIASIVGCSRQYVSKVLNNQS